MFNHSIPLFFHLYTDIEFNHVLLLIMFYYVFPFFDPLVISHCQRLFWWTLQASQRKPSRIPIGQERTGREEILNFVSYNLFAFPYASEAQKSMGDLQDPIDGGTLVPYVWPYFLGIFPYIGLKQRPYIW